MEEITKTVYSVCYPLTKDYFEEFKSKNLSEMYEKTWTKKQDTIHIEFYYKWKEWVKPKFKYNATYLSNFYPTNGSSEAIREQIVYLYSKGKRLVVFEGEYEGYEAIANSVGMQVIKINRENFENDNLTEFLKLKKETDVFFISEPSSIDGNFWKYFDKFIKLCEELRLEVYLDIAYVGASNQKNCLSIEKSTCINGVFFSFSKIFGVYYHRIGGVILKDKNPLLYGNMWFKNIFSIEFGKYLMEKIEIGKYDNILIEYQRRCVEYFSSYYKTEFKCSDVFLLSTVNKDLDKNLWQKDFIRNENSKDIRVCISPKLENLIYDKN